MNPRPDRLRQLLDAVLAEPHDDLAAMAAGAHASPFHFSRLLHRGAGEPPVTMRRRVMLERAAWQLEHGSSVTDAAFAAGYEPVEGSARAFARAYGRPPSAPAPAGTSVWLPAPNGIHYHPPSSLWVDGQAPTMAPLAQQLVEHEVDDTAHLLDLAKGLSTDAWRRVRAPDRVVLPWDREEPHLAAVLERLVWTRESWLASLEGTDTPDRRADDTHALLARHAEVAPRWMAFWREVDRRGAWDDTLVDALCDPPGSFQTASVLAHVVTFSAHRRRVARGWMRECGLDPGIGDPILWQRTRKDDR